MTDERGFWNSPVPYPDSRKEILLAVVACVVFFIGFMLFFQPFGVNNYDPSESLNVDLIIGVVSLAVIAGLVLVLNELFIRPSIFPSITRLQLIPWLMWTMLLVAFASFLAYNMLGGWHDWRFSSYLEFVVNMTGLFALPLVGVGLILHQRSLHRKLSELRIEEESSRTTRKLVLTGDGKKSLSLSFDEVIFIESHQNYVEIYTVGGAKHLVRSTLKKIEQQVDGTTLVRCHRTYVVNIRHVVKSTGNAHGLTLELAGADRKVPVSRSYVPVILNNLKSA